MTEEEQANEGAPLEMRSVEGRGRYYLDGKPVEDGMELELRVSQRQRLWLTGIWEWNGDPGKSPTFEFYIETGIAEKFWKVKFRLQEWARFRWPQKRRVRL